MLISALLFSIKPIASMLAKDMVNIELAKRIAPTNLILSSKQWLLDSLQSQHNFLRQRLGQQAAASSNGGKPDNAKEVGQELKEITSSASTEYLVHNWLEALFSWFQVIVLWHEPFVSLCTLSCLLSSFLLLTYLTPRFYATIMIALFIYNLNKFWFRHVWPDIRVAPDRDREEEMRLDVDRWTYLHPQLMTLKELGRYTHNLMESSEQYVERLWRFRRERPIVFCSLVCYILSCTAYIGNQISGVSLLFWTAVCLVSAPGIYIHLLPDAIKHWLTQTVGRKVLKAIQLSEVDADNDEGASETTPELSSSRQTTAPIEREAPSDSQSISQAPTGPPSKDSDDGDDDFVLL